MSESLAQRKENMEKRDESYPAEREGQKDQENDNTREMLGKGVDATIQSAQQLRKKRNINSGNGTVVTKL